MISLLILISTISGCISISGFASLVGVSIRTRRSTIGWKICVITVGTKKYQSIIKKKKEHDKIVLLAKSKLNSIEVLISKATIGSNIVHDEWIKWYEGRN